MRRLDLSLSLSLSLSLCLCLCLSLLLFSCYADELDRELSQEPFFDLAGYINEQVDSLRQATPTAVKTITLNGTTETKTLDGINYAVDLRVFRDADINRPAWLDKYEPKRRKLPRGGEELTYTALDSSMQTRRLRVVLRDERPVSIDIERRTGTVLSDGSHRLHYLPGRGYRIRTVQDNRFGGDIDALVEVSWK